MFFLSNRTCRTGLSRFGKLTFPKSADSQFLKTADCDYSEICRNKVTAYTFLLSMSPHRRRNAQSADIFGMPLQEKHLSVQA